MNNEQPHVNDVNKSIKKIKKFETYYGLALF
jgi:hypothetical protein